MKGLLNNPKFVMALAAGAFVVAGMNIFLPLFSDGAFNDEKIVPAVGLEYDSVVAVKVVSGDVGVRPSDAFSNDASLRGSSEIPDIGWVTAPRRDPFRFARNDEAVSLASEDSTSANENSAAKPISPVAEKKPVSVNAVVIGPDFKLAVVDGQLLKQGEAILDGRLKVLGPSAIEYKNKAGIREVIPVEHLNLNPNIEPTSR